VKEKLIFFGDARSLAIFEMTVAMGFWYGLPSQSGYRLSSEVEMEQDGYVPGDFTSKLVP